MAQEFPENKFPQIRFFLGDVRDLDRLKRAFHGVDYVIHAAALKQVPSCEFFPLEAVKTNILGTDNVLTVAQEFEVKKVVVLSTDKAAYPINAMGMSKALMEKVMVAKSRILDNKKTIFCGTRYGNVMASRGSVIPLFYDQIKANEAIFTFVAVDEQRKPVRIPELIPETDQEKNRFDGALRRRQLSLVLAGKIKAKDATELKALFESK